MGNTPGQQPSPELRELVQAANFSERDIKRLYKRFTELDKNHDGVLSFEELFAIPGIAENPLVQRVISIFDANSDGKVSFIEFLAGLAKLASGTDELKKIRFAFDIYDINKDGFITNGELFRVMRMMVGDNLNDQQRFNFISVQLQQLVDRTMLQADKDEDGMISFEEFCEMVSHLDFSQKLRFS
ncbi:putative protein phosphatase 2b regulatory subunit [Cardiosporidium cionae]|uniref:EF-hand domain-containing protein n=1 Tax=Cardiosporidium cionae TaxID=476202 RepID=A0ABQ7JEY6_9APIC|nr:putative protein phosphatase 2b regulatory subunit [Cardiosporidium cionae]|eukprot:KAF8822593.1 putative protein phosphatase 2b regulatory subunit [Cardiosporidium cionae]